MTRVGPFVAALMILGGTAGCRHADAPATDTTPAAIPIPPGAVAVVHLTASAPQSIDIHPVTTRMAPRALRATGRVQFDDGRVARLIAPVSGQVSGLTAQVGDRVQAGQTIFWLASRDAQSALEDALDADRDLDLATKTLKMTQELFAHQAASQMALDQAESDAAKAKIRVARTAAAVKTMGLPAGDGSVDARVPVTSPISGVVIERHVSDGQFVQPDPAPLATIADLSTVWVEADVFETDLRELRPNQTAEVTTAADADGRFSARVARISDVIDPTTHTAKVRFVVANGDGRLKPEMFATVTLFVDELRPAVIVPAAAILTEGARTFVYVALDDRTFARRPVEVGPDDSGPDGRRILQGLAAGDRVVTKGAILLRAEEDRAGES